MKMKKNVFKWDYIHFEIIFYSFLEAIVMMSKKINVYDSVRDTNQNQLVDLWEVIHSISEGEILGLQFREIIEEIKTISETDLDRGEKEVKRLKRQLPVFVAAVNCSYRNSRSILNFTGFMVLDIDYEFRLYTQEELDRIKEAIFTAENHIICAFLSPSKGIKLIINIGNQINSLGQYSTLFNTIVAYYKKKHGIEIDKSGRDAVRNCFFSYDPNILSRPDSVEYVANSSIQESIVVDSLLNSLHTDDFGIMNSNIQTTSPTESIDLLKMRIANLSELDRRGVIPSKHDEMLKIQLSAVTAIRQFRLNAEEVYGELFEEWKKIYPYNQSKLNDFQNAWIGAINKGKSIEFLNYDVNGLIVNSDKFDYSRYLQVKESKRDEVLLTLNAEDKDITFLARTNVSCLVALPGSGKTSIVESICSKLIEPQCEGIHFELGDSVKKILLVDTENSDYDLSMMLDRISKRTTSTVREILSSNQVSFISTIEKEIVEEIKVDVLQLISDELCSNNYDLIIIDDVSALVNSSNEGVNSISASTHAINTLNKLARKHNCGFLVTIHSNSQRSNGKARGWLGSEIERYSMSVLHLIKDMSAFMISADSDSAKLRRGGLVSLSNSPLYYHFNTLKGYMCEMSEEELANIPNRMQPARRNISINKEIEEFIETNYNDSIPMLKKTVLSHLGSLYPDLSVNVLDKQFLKWKNTTQKYKAETKNGRCVIFRI
jgi:hypothetical protein